MFQKLLYPTSGSPLSTKIATTITDLLADYPDTEVIVAYAVKPQHIYSPAVAKELAENGIDPAHELIDEIKENLHRITQILKTNQVHYRVKIVYGEAAEAISNLAKEEKADVMVIGYHGECTLTDHLFKGNVMNRLIDASPCPVLVIK